MSWKLYTAEGEPLAHADCPMAVAVKEGRPVRGVTAQAERPDGTRVQFMPLPTPLHGDNGEVLGAVNMLIDVSDARRIADLKAQALRCRRLAESLNDRRAIAALTLMATEYDTRAQDMEQARD